MGNLHPRSPPRRCCGRPTETDDETRRSLRRRASRLIVALKRNESPSCGCCGVAQDAEDGQRRRLTCLAVCCERPFIAPWGLVPERERRGQGAMNGTIHAQRRLREATANN